MKSKEFDDAFDKVVKETGNHLLNSGIIKKAIMDNTDEDGKISNDKLAAAIFSLSTEYSNRVTYNLLKEFLVDEK